ncbi:MAG TPA: hypothetical protein QGG32_04860 [Rhodospirillales bacterium]|jgi:hypothetical protein|nr:hypothetical protein [Rhodospirillales bacterium]
MIKANVKAVREVVGFFAGRDSFEAAVAGLTEAGFAHTDLSVLGSHESLDAAGGILRANSGTNVHVHEYSSAAERT